ncbi:hypothetical protein SAMN05444586_10051 [Acinetobacter bohemicus]|uniref:Uncharacterized protein n=1 Tax=Acinetobacter bohemicus TaxID=1435036 RepID=A0A1I6RCU1_9GAMM|nr:hypothetical protein SAMN05444586_10051 [Acinetobacter bohemicus]
MKLKGSTALNRMQIEQVASRGLNSVHFSKTLERIYQEQYKNEAAYEFRFRGLINLSSMKYFSFLASFGKLAYLDLSNKPL